VQFGSFDPAAHDGSDGGVIGQQFWPFTKDAGLLKVGVV
jgi:hypothetical protein